MKRQRGGFAVGLIIGLLCGLLLALGVALYIAKVPIPFVNKVPHRTAEQDAAEAERNKSWDPNAPLTGKPGQLPQAPGPSATASAPAATAAASSVEPAASAPAPRTDVATPAAPPRDPAAILSGQPPAPEPAASSAAPFIYFVQAGAWSRVEDAEQQRASLAMLGITARLSEREQNGRTVHRVRVGPFATKEEAESSAGRLRASGSEATLVRVDKPRP